MSLGMSLYGMKTVPLAQALQHCARIGYRNVELCLDPGFPTEPAKFDRAARAALRTQAEDLRLEISGVMLNLNLATPGAHAANLVAIRNAAELAHAVAPHSPPPIETIFRGKPNEWDALKAGMVERLIGWADVAREMKVRFVVKAHVNSAVDTPERLLWLLREANRPAELRVAYDYSHFELKGLEMAASWAALAPLTDFVHVKDTAGDEQKPVMLLPGDGRTDYRALFELFQKSGYRGPVVAEVSSQIFNKPGYDPVKAAEKCYAFLAPRLAAAQGKAG